MDIQDRLTKYMDELEKALSTSAEFAAKEAPLVVQEFLAWEFWSSILFLLMFLGAAAVCAIVLRYSLQVVRKGKYELDELLAFYLVIGSVIGLVVCPIGVCSNGYRAAKVSIAPRLVLLEKVSELAHGKSK